ncbi:MAG: hypothetical protein Q8M08_00595 [Bacteroidales bacterium]|nr:hypothetical protein [Bacteroidales bacterium]
MQQPAFFTELFAIFAGNQEPASRRAVWVVDTVSEKNPQFIAPFLNDIVDMLPSLGHDGLKRHAMRILARSPLPTNNRLARLIKVSFEWLLSPQEAIATKVHCMEALYRISQTEPDLKKELADSIELRLNEETPGFKNRGQKLLKKLYAEINNATEPY